MLWLAAAPQTALAASGDCTTSGQIVTCTYTYTGASETFTVPAGVAGVRIVARGAAGAVGSQNSPTDALGGQGGEVSANLAVSPNQSLVLVVGGAPTGGDCFPGVLCIGGFNGGGTSSYGGGGGGASDVRVGGSGLAQRVLVAAGGGGGGNSFYCDDFVAGGNGGNAGSAGSAGAGCRGVAGGMAASLAVRLPAVLVALFVEETARSLQAAMAAATMVAEGVVGIMAAAVVGT